MSKQPTVFLSNRLLSAAADSRQENLPLTERAVADDVETLCWVILYVVHKRSLASLKASKSEEAHGLLDDELSKIFSARDVGTLVDQRVVAFNINTMRPNSYVGINTLLDHLKNQDPCPALRTLVAVVWRNLRLCSFTEALLDDPLADLQEAVAENDRKANKGLEALGLPVRPYPATVLGDAGRHTVDVVAHHHGLMLDLKNMINTLEAERAA